VCFACFSHLKAKIKLAEEVAQHRVNIMKAGDVSKDQLKNKTISYRDKIRRDKV
jgi:hypothetical protein